MPRNIRVKKSNKYLNKEGTGILSPCLFFSISPTLLSSFYNDSLKTDNNNIRKEEYP